MILKWILGMHGGAYVTGSGSCSLVEFDIRGNVISASAALGSECDVC